MRHTAAAKVNEFHSFTIYFLNCRKPELKYPQADVSVIRTIYLIDEDGIIGVTADNVEPDENPRVMMGITRNDSIEEK